ncbi:MAG: DUF4450 domain-containing protein [Bacteroidaceae bacterium]|nr:DUF4450 domain-containing protein [Bacteroidaceae bacterium]
MKTLFYTLLGGLLVVGGTLVGCAPEASRQEVRAQRYAPDGEDFVIVNGDRKFTRALYGGHTGFRVETSDVPEFAFYLPRMGGNLTFTVRVGETVLPLNNAERIECRYRPGKRIYHITDPLLGEGSISMEVLALMDEDAGVWKITTSGLPTDAALGWKFGGVANKRFSREGDMGVDRADCFDLLPEYCKDNEYTLAGNNFSVKSIKNKYGQHIVHGFFPEGAVHNVVELAASEKLQSAGADFQGAGADFQSADADFQGTAEESVEHPVLLGSLPLEAEGQRDYYMMIGLSEDGSAIDKAFAKAEEQRAELAGRIQFVTPDPYFNTIGGALAVAADGVWDGTTWLHGAIGWRMPLAGWRAAYAGDALGWHDRARKHFNAYAASQVTDVEPIYQHPMQDSTLNLARAVKKWGTQMYSNGYICRNPNRDNQMHHYDMNLNYMDELLWHLNWTGDWAYVREIWPVIERHLAWEKRNFDPDGDGLYDAYCCIWASDALYYNGGAATHSTALNYRANRMAARLAEGLGMSEKAAHYQAEADRIYKAIDETLWMEDKGVWAECKDLMGHQRLHKSPAVWTIYHTIDSEVGTPLQRYRATQYVDNEIPHIPVVAEGLDAKADGLGYEQYATISTTNWQPYAWSINNVAFAEVMHTALVYWMAGRYEAGYHLLKSSMLDGMYLGGSPGNFGQISHYDVARAECYRDFGDPVGVASRVYIQGLYGVLPDRLAGRLVLRPGFPKTWNEASLKTPDIAYSFKRESATDVYRIALDKNFGVDTLLLQVRAYRETLASAKVNGQSVAWRELPGYVDYPMMELVIPAKDVYDLEVELAWSGEPVDKGEIDALTRQDAGVSSSTCQLVNSLTNILSSQFEHVEADKLEPVSLAEYVNDSLTNLFQPRYFSPRPERTTLQIPVQGIGEWCHPQATFELNDSALRVAETLNTSVGVPFLTPVKGHNVVFTTLWDNFPSVNTIPLSGKAGRIYLMMAGSTNAMQSQIENGVVRVAYADGSADSLLLINPESWIPIEQDFYDDGLAFRLKAKRPYRLHLKTGLVSRTLSAELGRDEQDAAHSVDLNSTGIFGNVLEGGAATLYDLPLDGKKELKHLQVEALSNDVVIGLLGVTLQR